MWTRVINTVILVKKMKTKCAVRHCLKLNQPHATDHADRKKKKKTTEKSMVNIAPKKKGLSVISEQPSLPQQKRQKKNRFPLFMTKRILIILFHHKSKPIYARGF